jgi:hypothetical protein
MLETDAKDWDPKECWWLFRPKNMWNQTSLSKEVVPILQFLWRIWSTMRNSGPYFQASPSNPKSVAKYFTSPDKMEVMTLLQHWQLSGDQDFLIFPHLSHPIINPQQTQQP